MTTALLEPPAASTYHGQKMTLEQFHRLPDDGADRELIGGVVYEYTEEQVMSRRNRLHCRTTANATAELLAWSRDQPEPRGEVLDGDAGFVLSEGEGTEVGIDVAYISAELSKSTPEDQTFVEGPPVLAVEVMSPSDTVKGMKAKVEAYLAAGVEAVWYLDPYDRDLTIYCQGQTARTLNYNQRVENEPYLPGFAVDVAAFFDK